MPALATRAIATGPISGALPTPPNGYAAQDQVYVVEFTAYDLTLPGTRTLRYATHAFTTRPTDSPADTHLDGRLMEPGDIARSLGQNGIPGPRASVTFGELVLINDDGALDVIGAYGLGGREVVVRRGPRGGQYPYDFAVDFIAEIEAVTVTRTAVRLRLRDGRRSLEVPLQETRYAGDNVPPDGLEGGADIEGTPKPLVYGAVRNIPLVPVNAQKLIYQVSENAVQTVVDVFDSGLPLGTYAPVNFSTVVAGGTRFKACVADDTLVALTTTSGIETSPDGTTWTVRTSPFTTPTAAVSADITYSPTLNRVCAIASFADPFPATTCTTEVATSDDKGATWTLQTPAAVASNKLFIGANWCPRRELFILVGGGGGGESPIIQTSPDGITWTNRTPPGGVTEPLFTVAVGGASLVAVGGAGTVCTSPDGITWSGANGTLGANSIFAALWTNGSYIIAAKDMKVYRSIDAQAWTEVISGDNLNDNTPLALAEAGGVVFLYGYGTTPRYSYSTDSGRTWQAVSGSLSNSGDEATVVPFNDRWYVIGTAGVDRSGAATTYASLAALEDDTLEPVAGSFKWIAHATGTYVRLGIPPVGTLTADVNHGATAALRSPAQLMQAVLLKAGFTAADWMADDFTALDAAAAPVCGLYLTTDTAASALDRLADSIGAFWYFDDAGRFRVQQFTAASGSAVLSLTDDDLVEFDQLPFLQPSYRTTLRYAEHVVVQTDGLVGGVTAARRAVLGRQWREVTEADTAVLTAHLLAEDTTEATALVNAAEATTEAARRQTLRGTMRRRYSAVVARTDRTATVRLGEVVHLTSARFGCSGGVLMRVTALDTRRGAHRLRLTLYR